MNKILINGCSASANSGWDDPNGKVWWHPLSAEFGGNNEITRISRDGNSNHEMMVDTIDATLKNSYDLVIIQWTTFLRQNFYLAKSIDASDRVHFGLMPRRPPELSRRSLKGSKHEASLIHWQENFLNRRKLYNTNFTYFITTANYLLQNRIPFVFLNCISGNVLFNDLLEPNWMKTTEEYRNQVLLWPVCGDAEAERGHQELHNKVMHLEKLCGNHWAGAANPGCFNPFLIFNGVDLSDDGQHPGIKFARQICDRVVSVATSLDYSI